MDDVALIHDDKDTLQKMMDITNDIAKRYHKEFGAAKCKIIKIGRGKDVEITLNNKKLEQTETYKYLGEIFNNKNNLKNHIEEINGKVYMQQPKKSYWKQEIKSSRE